MKAGQGYFATVVRQHRAQRSLGEQEHQSGRASEPTRDEMALIDAHVVIILARLAIESGHRAS